MRAIDIGKVLRNSCYEMRSAWYEVFNPNKESEGFDPKDPKTKINFLPHKDG